VTVPHDLIGIIVAVFAPPLAKAIAAELRTDVASEYDSRTALPSGVTGRAFRVRCKCIPEARQEGKVWRCPRETWHASFPQVDRTPVAPELDAYERAARGVK
jgi:hypothetical protein